MLAVGFALILQMGEGNMVNVVIKETLGVRMPTQHIEMIFVATLFSLLSKGIITIQSPESVGFDILIIDLIKKKWNFPLLGLNPAPTHQK